MKCPKCDRPITLVAICRAAWADYDGFPIICDACEAVTWLRRGTDIVLLDAKSPKESIPSLIEGTKVYVINREHSKYLEPGVIIRRSHIHYRVLFNNGTTIWMPEHWILAIPAEMLGEAAIVNHRNRYGN